MENNTQNNQNTQASAIPDDVQQRIDERMRTADNRLISAEVRAVGAGLNIIDIDAAFALMDKSGVKIRDDGRLPSRSLTSRFPRLFACFYIN